MRHWLPIVIILLAHGPRAGHAAGWNALVPRVASSRCHGLAIAVATRASTTREADGCQPEEAKSASDRKSWQEPAASPLSEPTLDGVRSRDGPYVS